MATRDAVQRRSSSFCGTALTCALEEAEGEKERKGGCYRVKHTLRRNQAIGQNLSGQFLGNGKLIVWASAKKRECYDEVEQEDEDRQSIAQDIFAEEHGLPEAAHRTSRRTGRSHLVVRVPFLSLIPS